MKQIISQTNLIINLLFFSGCTINNTLKPSQNKALNSISSSNAKKKNYRMQQQLDNFFKHRWEHACYWEIDKIFIAKAPLHKRS